MAFLSVSPRGTGQFTQDSIIDNTLHSSAVSLITFPSGTWWWVWHLGRCQRALMCWISLWCWNEPRAKGEKNLGERKNEELVTVPSRSQERRIAETSEKNDNRWKGLQKVPRPFCGRAKTEVVDRSYVQTSRLFELDNLKETMRCNLYILANICERHINISHINIFYS